VLVDFGRSGVADVNAVSPDASSGLPEATEPQLVKVNIDENQDLAMRYGNPVDPEHDPLRGRPAEGECRSGAMPKGMLERSLGLGE